MRSPIHKVFSKVATYVHDINVDDTAVVFFEHESGAISDLKVGWSARSSRFSQEVHGTEGSILFGSILGQPSQSPPLELCTADGCEALEVPEMGFWGFNGLFKEFVEGFENRRTPVPMTHGLRNLKIIMAAYESSKLGKPVEV